MPCAPSGFRRADDVNAGVDAIRKRVIAGLRDIELEDLEGIIRDTALEPAPKTATLMVQAIDRRDTADMATASVDWVDLFVGEEPGVRRELHDPADWDGRLRPELQAAIQTIRSTGMTTVAIEGAMRLSVFFLAGRELSSVSGFNVTHNARGVEWASQDTSTTMDLVVTAHDISAGDDIAIGLSVTGDITEDVLDYVQRAKLPVAKNVIEIAPAIGPGRDALTPENAPEWAEATIAEIKRASRGHGKIHLFLYGPGQAALLLGHAWNRLPTVQVYEDLGPGGRDYTPTFLIPARPPPALLGPVIEQASRGRCGSCPAADSARPCQAAPRRIRERRRSRHSGARAGSCAARGCRHAASSTGRQWTCGAGPSRTTISRSASMRSASSYSAKRWP